MSIEYAILGLLSWKPMSGYDIKKIISESSFMYWSGNNNQIYRVLLNLNKKEFVKAKTIHEDGAPSKKIYSITDLGENELKNWVVSPTEIPIVRNTFLIKFAWSHKLCKKEIKEQIEKYQNEITNQLLISEEKAKRKEISPNRDKQEEVIWEMIMENILSYYRNELKWIRSLKNKLGVM